MSPHHSLSLSFYLSPSARVCFGSDAVADVTSHGEKKMGRQITSKFTVISVLSVNSLNSEENHVQNNKSHGPSVTKNRKSLS